MLKALSGILMYSRIIIKFNSNCRNLLPKVAYPKQWENLFMNIIGSNIIFYKTGGKLYSENMLQWYILIMGWYGMN